MDTNGWNDIGYNFVVGEDGNIYEGRGWSNQGAHAANWNSISIGIAIIGDFTSKPICIVYQHDTH
jgi:N-acetylmuramoyl-L-alanine amidase